MVMITCCGEAKNLNFVSGVPHMRRGKVLFRESSHICWSLYIMGVRVKDAMQS